MSSGPDARVVGAPDDVHQRRSSRRPRVAVVQQIAQYPAASGVGKMWRHVVAELRSEGAVTFADPARRMWFPRPSVWLHDGHQGPIDARGPIVTQLHEAAWNEPATRALLDPAFVRAYEEPSRAAAKRASRIVTPSESSRRQIVDEYGVPESRVIVAPHGVDCSVFHPAAPGGPQLVARAGGDAGRPYVVFVSQLHPRKNLPVLRTAMTRLAQRGFPHALVVVGDSPVDRADSATIERDAVADLPGTTGRVVRLRGLEEEQLAGVMASAAVLCLPSLMEGFGLTVLEAMACGTPVVVSDRGALPEVAGEAGVVTEPTADGVEAALAELLSDDEQARRSAEAGLMRSRAFTWRATAEQWRRAIDEAIASG